MSLSTAIIVDDEPRITQLYSELLELQNLEIDKVFSKFYQVDMSNTREKGGVGLGLSICQKIIDAHDGKIWIESELDKETTINFSLPRK